MDHMNGGHLVGGVCIGSQACCGLPCCRCAPAREPGSVTGAAVRMMKEDVMSQMDKQGPGRL